MLLRQLLFAFFALTFLNLSAQEELYTLELTYVNNNDLAFSGINYTSISDGNYNSFESSQFEILKATNSANLNNFMIVDDFDESQMALAYGQKFKRRHPLEKTGRILTYVGVPLAIIGGIMVSGADELYYECVNGDCSGDARGGFGVVLLGAGTGLSITGAVLWIVGAKK
jgi:hypothetical protein